MTLSSFTSHSLAVQSVLEQHPGPSVSQVSVRCFGNLIGVMFHSFDTETFQQSLIIYDWKTGVAKAVRLTLDVSSLQHDTLPGPLSLVCGFRQRGAVFR